MLSLLTAATFIVTMPIEREDNTVLLQEDIGSLNIYCGDNTGDYIDSYTTTELTYPDTYFSIPMLGSQYCVATVSDIDGRESMYSDEVNLSLPPEAPTIVCSPNADLNGDGVVNAADLAILKQHFFQEY